MSIAKEYSLKRRLIASQLASVLQSIFNFVVNLATKIALARLLLPADFGLFALAGLFFLGIDTVRDLGIGNNIIRSKEEIYYGNAILIHVIFSSALITAVILFGDLFSKFDPRLPGVLKVYVFLTAINSFGQLAGVYLRKNLLLAKAVIPRAVCAVVYLLTAIILAKKGFGVFSFVYAQIISISLLAALLWYIFIKNTKIEFTFRFTKKLLKTSRYFLGLGVLFAILPNIDYGILGLKVSAAQIGYYFMALSLVTISHRYITPLFYYYIFSLFSELQDDKGALYKYYKLTTCIAMMLIVPICAFLFFKADSLVLLLYGKKWLPVIFILKALSLWPILCPYALFGDDIINIKNEKVTFYSYIFYFVCFTISGHILIPKIGIIGCVIAKYISELLASLPRLFRLSNIFDKYPIFFKEYLIIYTVPFLTFFVIKEDIFSSITAFLAIYIIYFIIFRRRLDEICDVVKKSLPLANIGKEFLVRDV